MLSHRSAPLVLLATVVAHGLLLSGPADALTSGERTANAAPRIVLGADPGEQFGATLVMPGDITGDGVPDLLVGAPGAREGSGRVYLFSGSTMLEARAVQASEAWAVFEGTAGTAFGSSLAVLGDVDGDGWTDWALGAPQFPGGDAPPGRLWVMPGSATVADTAPGELEDVALAVIDGPNDAALLGQGVSGIGDIDGDGRADLAVVVRDAASAEGTGEVRLIHGRAASNWPASTEFHDHMGAGYSVTGLGDPSLGFTLDGLLAPAGDLDGDGLGDVWVGLPAHTGDQPNAPTRAGLLMLLPGQEDLAVLTPAAEAAMTTFLPDPTLFGSVDLVDAHFGQPLSTSRTPEGDILWVGSDGPDRGTALGLAVGPAPYVTEEGVVAAVAAPPAVMGGLSVRRGDLLGTGEPALIVGVPLDGDEAGSGGAGRLAVLADPAEAVMEVTAAYAAFLGAEGEQVGAAVAVANLDMDAYDDALVGAPGAYGAGAVLVLLGSELADGDGFAPSEGDCDDALATVHPGAEEIAACADALDNDCNGLVDGEDEPCVVEGSGIVVGCSATGGGGSLFGLLLLPLVRRRRRAAALVLVGAAMALLGCPTAEPTVDAPAIQIVSPGDTEALEASPTLAIEVAVSGARLAPELQGVEPDVEPARPQPVLWSLYVDEFFRGTGGGPLQVAEGLGPGTHNIRAELVDTLGEPLDPPVTAEISVNLIAGEPTVVLTEPTNGEVLSPSGFAVEYDVAGLLLNSASIGQPNQLGVGHALITLDGSLVATDADGQAFVSNPGTGEHVLAVTLVNNDGTDLDPPVSDSVSITVAEPEITITSPTTESPGDVLVTYEVANFTLDPVNLNGMPEEGRGHTHIYLDGLYQGLDAMGQFTLPDVDGCDHTLRLELALAGHAELGISDEVQFSIRPCVAIEGVVDNDEVISSLGAVNITYTSPGHDISLAQGRYVTHYLDGAYVGFSAVPGNATFLDVQPGLQTFEIRLASGQIGLGGEQAGELDPRASAQVTLDVVNPL